MGPRFRCCDEFVGFHFDRRLECMFVMSCALSYRCNLVSVSNGICVQFHGIRTQIRHFIYNFGWCSLGLVFHCPMLIEWGGNLQFWIVFLRLSFSLSRSDKFEVTDSSFHIQFWIKFPRHGFRKVWYHERPIKFYQNENYFLSKWCCISIIVVLVLMMRCLLCTTCLNILSFRPFHLIDRSSYWSVLLLLLLRFIIIIIIGVLIVILYFIIFIFINTLFSLTFLLLTLLIFLPVLTL
jgi:hypothetical protein